ncbi:sterol O-acyltransferase 2-like isoform X2 [Hyperolius riggenbachi]|uniref:sterol O-acyltransferase 2-like isoform X2 n=1 Tax=Hyperolius riggenbachi TaxID=752182 RepID=UPI0035A2B03E
MTPTEEASETAVRQRNGIRTKEQAVPQQNVDASSPNSNLSEWNRHMEGVKAEVVEEISAQLKILLDKAMKEAEQSYKNEDKTAKTTPQQGSQSPVFERKKVFVHRASLLEFVLKFDLLFYTFGQLDTVAWCWICMFTYTLLIPYKTLHFWGSLYPKTKHKFLLNAFTSIFLLVCQTCVLFIFPVSVVRIYRVPPASSFVVILESFRLFMKSYAIFRESVPAVLHAEKKEILLPKLSSYLYFLFCPTLIYRDSYPRTPKIRWNYVIKYFAQFLACLFLNYYVMVHLCVPVFTNMSKQPFTIRTLVLSIFHATLPGALLLLSSFFGFLHSWMNAFAEMLRFADRMFYKDWWNSTSFSNYYRTWNVIIHDWLYYYMYQDLLWLLKGRFRAGVLLAVFLLSASVHEYAFTLSFGFFYPVMFCLFAILGVCFNFVINDKRTSPVYNVIVWTFLFLGQGIQVCLYCQEWYAQIHCPLKEKTFWGLVTPRSWSCHL